MSFLKVNQWWSIGKKTESWWEACCVFSNYVRDLESVCVVLSRSTAPQKDRHGIAFLQRLVNRTLCPVEQKKASSPCPVWLACRSHCLPGQSQWGVTLVKTKQKSMWNTESHFKRQSWWLPWPSMGQACKNPAGALRAHLLLKFWSYQDMETTVGSYYLQKMRAVTLIKADPDFFLNV